MAEVKTGLEVEYGYVDQTGTVGLVYYNDITGSAGTKNLGVGTAANTGTSVAYFGSGLVFASGVPKIVAQSTVAIGSAGKGFATYNIEVGSDGTVHATTGGTAADVAGAIAARAAAAADHAKLAYVTVGSMGSVLSGSIVDERTMGTATALSYVTGFAPDLSDNPIHIFNGSTYAHSKPGRLMGKFSLKTLQVNDVDPWSASGGAYMTKPRIAFEADYKGVAGTSEFVELYANASKESRAVDNPEEAECKVDYSAFYGTRMKW